jgi:hypothetical protein
MTNKALANKIRKIFEEMAYNNCEKHLVYDGYTEIRCSMISVAFHDDRYDYEVCFYNYGNSIGATSLKYGAMNSRSTQFKTDKHVITVMLAELMTRKDHFVTMKREVETSELEEASETSEAEETEEAEEVEETEEATSETLPHVDVDCSNLKKVPKNCLYGMFGGFPSISEMYNDKCFCCIADRKGNECKGKETCGKTWKRYEAIINPEWHHVSLATLANIDFDMLDKKRQVYLKAHSELKRTLADLSKCKTGHTYEARARKFMRDMISQYYDNEISYAMRKYLDLQLSMANVINGVWSSYVEPATGLHESRRYNRPTLTY